LCSLRWPTLSGSGCWLSRCTANGLQQVGEGSFSIRLTAVSTRLRLVPSLLMQVASCDYGSSCIEGSLAAALREAAGPKSSFLLQHCAAVARNSTGLCTSHLLPLPSCRSISTNTDPHDAVPSHQTVLQVGKQTCVVQLRHG
jgi:hypothetical protein